MDYRKLYWPDFPLRTFSKNELYELCQAERADERRKICQMVKDNNGSIEGKDGMVVTTQEDFENILAETETNAIRKFAIWLRDRDYLNECHVFHSDVDYTQPTVNEVLNEYEREKNI